MHESPQIITVDGFKSYKYKAVVNEQKLIKLLHDCNVPPGTIRTIKIFPTSKSLEPNLPPEKRSRDFGFWDSGERLIGVNFRLDDDGNDYTDDELVYEAIESLAHEIFHASNEKTKRIIRIARHLPASCSAALGLAASIVAETNRLTSDLFAQINPLDGDNAIYFKFGIAGACATIATLITNKRIKRYAQDEENSAYAFGQDIVNSKFYKDLLQLVILK